MLVGSKVGSPPDGVTLTETTPEESFFPTLHALEALARECSILEFLEGNREVPKLSQHTTEIQYFRSALEFQRQEDIKVLVERLKSIGERDSCFIESLRIINDPADPNPSIDGKRKSPQEAANWRSQNVVVSTAAVRHYIAMRLGGPIEGPEHPASKQLVLENLPANYISVYSDNLTEEQLQSVRTTRPPDGLSVEFMVNREAELCTSIARYENGDDLDAIKAKIKDIGKAEKSFQDSHSRHNANQLTNNKLNGDIEKFLNKHVPIVQTLAPELVVTKDWPKLWKGVKDHFIEKCGHHLDANDNASKLAPFDVKTENVLGFKRRLGKHLALRQSLSQEAHSDHRGLSKVDYNSSLTDCFLTNEDWKTKYPGPNGAVKETKDASVRTLIKTAFKADRELSNRILVELRSDSDATPQHLFSALVQEEKLLKRASSDSSAISVSAVRSNDSDELNAACNLHGPLHTNVECRLQSSGKVVYDKAKGDYVFKDTGKVFKRKAPNSADDNSSPQKKSKRESSDLQQGKSSKHDKKEKKDKEVHKDKKKEEKKKKKSELKRNKSVGKVIDSLKTTLVSLVQGQSSSSSASAAPAAASTQSAPSQDGSADKLEAISKQILDLKSALGLEP